MNVMARRAVQLVIVALVLAALGASAVLLSERTWLNSWFLFDVRHPDHDAMTAAFGPRGPYGVEETRPVDFSSIQGGDWQVLCLVGGFGRPAQSLSKAARDHQVSLGLWSWLLAAVRATRVPEFDLALIYADRAGGVHLRRFPGYGSLYAQHLDQCVTAASPVMTLRFQR
jgi:hypothetical protein